ncbi:hypothetical protein ACHAW5_008091 [Stephanodiscus triporus]|uniref:Uncharacterized protein n=1 Tax=Stephanodiscus triporus TaxID=2934178 RepID=A0ABD3P9M4_9STRA
MTLTVSFLAPMLSLVQQVLSQQQFLLQLNDFLGLLKNQMFFAPQQFLEMFISCLRHTHPAWSRETMCNKRRSRSRGVSLTIVHKHDKKHCRCCHAAEEGSSGEDTAKDDGKSQVKWQKSDGNKFLRKELQNLHSSDPRFSEYPLKNFTTNFKNLKKKVDGLIVRVDFDEQAVSQHKKSYPRSSSHETRISTLEWASSKRAS